MRLLIVNDLDEWIVRKVDIRAWAQRMLWFAEPGDVLVMMSPPDPLFVEYVARMKGFDPATLTIRVLPRNRFGGKLFDHLALYDQDFIDVVAGDAHAADQVIAAWPSPHVAAFVRSLGLADRWPGSGLFAQGGAEFLNSMGSFRAFATAAGAQIADGTVCRSRADAEMATRGLLSRAPAVMIKKSHGGAGAGNHILLTDPDLAVGHAGGKFLTVIGHLDEVADFWKDRWDWASADGAYPVVVEEFQRGARSIYAEYSCQADKVELGAVGELHFTDRRLARETVPVTDLDRDTRERLTSAGRKIADLYHRLGYRGPLSADSVITADGTVTFTEVNAQYTGSTHLYSVLVGQLGAGQCQVTQLTSLEHWPITGLDAFLDTVTAAGCGYDPVSRRGLVAITPKIGEGVTGPLIFGVLHDHIGEVDEAVARLDEAFARRVPAGAGTSPSAADGPAHAQSPH